VAEEAVIKVILEGSGGAGTVFGGAGSPRPSTARAPSPASTNVGDAFDPFLEAQKSLERKRRQEEIKAAEAILSGKPLMIPPKIETIEQEAQRLFEAEQHRAEVQKAVAALRTPKTIEEEAQELFAAEQHRAEVQKAVAALRTPKTIEEEAQELLAAEQHRAEVQRAIMGLRTPEMIEQEAQDMAAAAEHRAEVLRRAKELEVPFVEPFDPAAQARKKRNEEINKEAVDREYQRMFPQAEKAESHAGLIGKIGGIFGKGGSPTGALSGVAELAGVAEMAAGPIAALAIIAPMIQKLGDAAAKTAKEILDFGLTTRSATEPAGKAISDFGKAVQDEGEELSSTLGPFTAVLMPGIYALGKLNDMVGHVVARFGELVDRSSELAERFGAYNIESARAQAEAQARTITGNVRRAQEAGPQLASFIKARTDLEQHRADREVEMFRRTEAFQERLLHLVDLFEEIKSQAGNPEVARGFFEQAITNPLLAVGNLIATSNAKIAENTEEKPEIGALDDILNVNVAQAGSLGGF